MKLIHLNFLHCLLLAAVLISCIFSCRQVNLEDTFGLSAQWETASNSNNKSETCCNLGVRSRALLSSRFKNLAHLKTVVSIQYEKDYLKLDSNEYSESIVNLTYSNNGEKIVRSMSSGVSQNDILNLQKASYFTRTCFVLAHPIAIRKRGELDDVYMLSRRKPAFFGPGDMSFYDFAEASFKNINTLNLAYQNARDSSEKGYINTFNHVTAQAIITSFFSEELADFIADLHERNNMAEITSGRFTSRQLLDSFNSPEDNYIDIINNEIGQRLGIKLREKYQLNDETICTPDLLTAYLNDIQSYYMWALEIGMDKFRSNDERIVKFSNKINALLNRS